MINIAVVDDQAIVRKGIVSLIEINPNFNVCIEANNGREALSQLQENQVDLIITDIQMPLLDGIEFVSQLRANNNNTPVLVLTTFDDNQLFINAIKAGCNGFLLKDTDVQKLTYAIETVADGGYLLEPQSIAPAQEADTVSAQGYAPLTDIEKQILRFAAAGFSNKEIAGCVHLADGTVKNYISRILEKTHSRDRTQAVVKAMQWNVL